MKSSWDENGPAVMLGNAASIFPAHLAAYWRSKGMEVALVSKTTTTHKELPADVRVVSSGEFETRLMRSFTHRVLNPILSRLENTAPRFKARFERATGLSADSEFYAPFFRAHVTEAWPVAKAALSLRPRFVFGHGLGSALYGYDLSTALCRGVPKILFPWGSDIFGFAESSPFQFMLAKFSLKSADLVVPSATVAARHIQERFGVSASKVQAVSWGVNRQLFKRAEGERRREIRAKWGISPGATVILNPRRFRPLWGGFTAVEAFKRLASEHPATHFILFGGLETEHFMEQAKIELERDGLLPRFTLLEGDAPLATCAELMSVSDIFVSLFGLGDMRSASVLQAAAAGGVPVVSNTPEYREMESLGFAGFFVKPDSVDEALVALRRCIREPEEARAMVERNEKYLATYEDHSRQMDKMLDLIDAVCERYARSSVPFMKKVFTRHETTRTRLGR